MLLTFWAIQGPYGLEPSDRDVPWLWLEKQDALSKAAHLMTFESAPGAYKVVPAVLEV